MKTSEGVAREISFGSFARQPSSVLSTTAGCGGTQAGATSTAPSGTAKKGGVLTIGAAQSIAELNPVTKANAWEQVLFSLMWDGLVKTGQDQKTIEPDLATSWTPVDRPQDLDVPAANGCQVLQRRPVDRGQRRVDRQVLPGPEDHDPAEEQRRADRRRDRPTATPRWCSRCPRRTPCSRPRSRCSRSWT